ADRQNQQLRRRVSARLRLSIDLRVYGLGGVSPTIRVGGFSVESVETWRGRRVSLVAAGQLMLRRVDDLRPAHGLRRRFQTCGGGRLRRMDFTTLRFVAVFNRDFLSLLYTDLGAAAASGGRLRRAGRPRPTPKFPPPPRILPDQRARR